MDIWAAIDQEREALVEDLALIDDSQWDAQSWCAEWKVRDVVGHLVWSRNLPPFVKSTCELADIVCHGEDIRGPLGLHREVPVATLLVAAEFLKDDRATGTPERIQGICLKATDADWSIGDGPIVAGPLQSLVLAMAGRGDAFDELSGDGLAQLRMKIGAV